MKTFSHKLNIIKTLSVIYLLLISISSKKLFEGENCRILALEGGGDNGAYQAGALKGLFENLSPEEVKYDIITGVSLGAFNAAMLAIHPLGEEIQAADFIVNTWKNLKSKDIYKNWTLGIIEGFLWKESLYNNEVELKKMETYFKDKSLHRYLVIGATNAKTADYEYFDNTIFEKYGVSGAIMASSALPPIFSSFKYIGNSYYDGTIKHSVDFITGVNMCRQKGFTDDKIILDAVLCNSTHISKFDAKNFHPLDSLMRLIEILSYDAEEYDREAFVRFFPKVMLNNVIMPSKQFPKSDHPYEFDQKDIEFMLELGYQDGKDQSKKKLEAS